MHASNNASDLRNSCVGQRQFCVTECMNKVIIISQPTRERAAEDRRRTLETGPLTFLSRAALRRDQ